MAERKIGNRTFKVDQPLATEAVRLQARLARALGGSMAKAFDAYVAANSSKAESKEAVAGLLIPIIADFFEKNDPDAVVDLVQYLMTFAQVAHQSGQYDPVDLDGDFYGSLNDIVPVCAFVIEEVVGVFLSGPGRSGSPAKRATAAA